MEEYKKEKIKQDGIDRGEIRTEYSIFHSDIERTGVSQCKEHSWKKRNDMEIECTKCPTVLVCSVDDERLLIS